MLYLHRTTPASYRSTVALIFLICTTFACKSQQNITRISNGLIKGVQEEGSLVFKGIPYASVQTGAQRFYPSGPVNDWKDTLSCENFGNVAAQYDHTAKTARGSEDCLSLNVYTPDVNTKAKRPVLVWIHGGGMTAGTGSNENGHAFSDRDSIVTVTINYRLGVFGFLYLGDQDPNLSNSGNNGLSDCITALKWIRKNISAFGGDPSRVTVMGQSAGAKLVSALLATPEAKGYFNQLIIESGGVQCIRNVETATALRKRFLDSLHVTRPTAVKDLSTARLIEAQQKFLGGAQGTNYFGPVSDHKSMFTEDPYQFIKNNPDRTIRVLIGSNTAESRLFMRMDPRLNHPDLKALTDWFGTNGQHVYDAYQKELIESDTLSAATKILSQYMYIMHSYRLADVLSKNGNPVWVYSFNYNRENKGSDHGQEMPYVWFKGSNPELNETELDIARLVHQKWVNFIKGKKPGHAGKYDWSWYQTRARSIMVFDQVSRPEILEKVYNDTQFPTSGIFVN